MLHPCLSIIHTELNTYIKAKTAVEEKVVLANLGDQIAKDEVKAAHSIIMSVVDIVKEEWGSTDKEYISQGNGGYITKNQPINFSIYVLFSAYSQPEHTLEGLKYLSLVIAFFQSKNYFNTLNTPSLQQLNLDNVSVELVNPGYQEKSALWNRIGVPYIPSVLYKLGIIPVEDTEAMGAKIPEIKEIIIQ